MEAKQTGGGGLHRSLPKGNVAAQVSLESAGIWTGVWKRPPLGVLAGWEPFSWNHLGCS